VLQDVHLGLLLLHDLHYTYICRVVHAPADGPKPSQRLVLLERALFACVRCAGTGAAPYEQLLCACDCALWVQSPEPCEPSGCAGTCHVSMWRQPRLHGTQERHGHAACTGRHMGPSAKQWQGQLSGTRIWLGLCLPAGCSLGAQAVSCVCLGPDKHRGSRLPGLLW
jgi:hypothetical protein